MFSILQCDRRDEAGNAGVAHRPYHDKIGLDLLGQCRNLLVRPGFETIHGVPLEMAGHLNEPRI